MTALSSRISLHDLEVKPQHLRIRFMRFGTAFSVFAIGVIVALLLQSQTAGFVSNDDYYHSRISSLMLEQGTLRVDFPWLPLTILSPEKFVDHHLLYHIYLAPFAALGGLGSSKLAQAIVFGGVFAAFWLLLRRLHIRHTWLWLIVLLGASTPFLYRMMMVRAQGAAVLFLLLALYVMFSQRYRWLMPIAFGFAWLYNGFVLMTVFAAIYMLSAWLTERKLIWQPVFYAVTGTAAGLIINPYFPQNIAFIFEHLGEKVDISASVRVGSEWYPYTTGALMENSLGMLLALAAGVLAPSLRKTGRDLAETALLLTALVTLYMAFESRRFIEYAPVFAVLFAAAALGRGDIQLSAFLPAFIARLPFRWLFTVLMMVPVGLLAWSTVQSAGQDVSGARSPDYMAGAAAWLEANTSPHELIFQTDWDDFTYLYYHNTQNTYLVGLDPTYLQAANPNLWNLWVPITQGLVERPSVLIRESFGARYVVSDTFHDAFAVSAEGDPNMELVYRDAQSLVWQIIDPPPEQ